MLKNDVVLITGVAGFIGYHLANKLLEDGLCVCGLDNLNDYYDQQLKNDRLGILQEKKNFSFHRIDISNKTAVNKIFSEVLPKCVINLAAQAGVRYSIKNPSAYIESNIVGFFNVLEACKIYKPELILFASSSSVYGSAEGSFNENMNTDKPISLYAATKKADEAIAYSYYHLFNLNLIGLRFFSVYGPWGRPDMAYFKFSDRIVKGEDVELYNSGDMFRDFTYVDDIVDAITTIISTEKFYAHPNYEIYNLGNNSPVPLKKLVQELEKNLDTKAKIKYTGMQPGDVYSTCADISKSNNDFGFSPTTNIEKGIKEFVDWYKSYYKIGT